MKNLLERLKNPGVLMGTGCFLAAIFIQFRVDIDIKWVEETLKLICGLGVLLGLLNNPETPKIDNPFKKLK